MLGQTSNTILQKVESQVEAKVKPQYQTAFKRVVMLGLQAMHSPQSHQYMVKVMNEPGDPAEKSAEGVIRLLGLMINKSKNTMLSPTVAPALFSAAQVLLCEALDFMAQTGKVQITNDTVSSATQALSSYYLQMLGVTPQKLQGMLHQVSAQHGGTPPSGTLGTPEHQSYPVHGPAAGIISGGAQ